MKLEKRRSILDIDPERGTVTKHYTDEVACARESYWYLTLDYGHPEVLDLDTAGGVLVTRYHTPCTELPNYRPIKQLVELLRRLETDGIHHRDVHIENIVQGPDGPLLIDWETAIHAPGHPSYDLHGPEVSGIPVPDIHVPLKRYRMWIGVEHRKSVKTLWNIRELPTTVDQRQASVAGSA